MPNLVELEDINQFLPKDKLTLAEEDREVALESTAKEVVLSSLAPRFDTDEWISKQTTPNLVVSIIGMFVAGWIYNRQYGADATDDSGYGNVLLAQANALIQGLVGGSLDIDSPAIAGDTPSYLESDPTFVMGEVF